MILALETATRACSAALCAADGSLVTERVALDGPAHSQLLLPFVREVMDEAEVSWEAITTVAVGLGPGAFTGLRIGVATARALVQAGGAVDGGASTATELRGDGAGASLAGVPTPAALAIALAAAPEARPGSLLLPLIDGRRREVFAAVYRQDGDVLVQVEGVAVVAVTDLAAWLTACAERHVVAGDDPAASLLVAGDGALLYAESLPDSAQLVAGIVAPTAAMVGRAVVCAAPGLVYGPDAVLPLYGRVPDARPRATAGTAAAVSASRAAVPSAVVAASASAEDSS